MIGWGYYFTQGGQKRRQHETQGTRVSGEREFPRQTQAVSVAGIPSTGTKTL